MDDLDTQVSLKALAANVLLPIAAITAVNTLVFGLGWNMASGPALPGLLFPVLPGWLVGVVWTCLFAMMGAARWRIRRARGSSGRASRDWLIRLMALCCAYPFYTLGLSNEIIGFAGNIATIIVAWVAFAKLRMVSQLAALAPASVAAWLCFATIYIVDEQRWWW